MKMRQIDCRIEIFRQNTRTPRNRRNGFRIDWFDRQEQSERVLGRQDFKKCLRHVERIIGRTIGGINPKAPS